MRHQHQDTFYATIRVRVGDREEARVPPEAVAMAYLAMLFHHHQKCVRAESGHEAAMFSGRAVYVLGLLHLIRPSKASHGFHSSFLLSHFCARIPCHPAYFPLIRKVGNVGRQESQTMWRSHLRYTLTALAFSLALSALPWARAAAPAKRPALAPAPGPTEGERALALFKAKTEQFQRFLAQEPLFLTKEDVSKSATGVLYYHVRIKLLKSALDVQRSDSLVSPFMGYLDLTYEKETNQSCG